MQDRSHYDSAIFWLGLGGAAVVIGGILTAVGVALVVPNPKASLWANGWFDFGLLTIAIGIGMLVWALVLFLAHRHIDSHLRVTAPRPQAFPARQLAAPPKPVAAPSPVPQPIVRPPEMAHAPAPPAAQQEPEPRIIVDRTPEQLIANFKGVTNTQGNDRVARYIGKWLSVSGPVRNVLGSWPDSMLLTFAGRSMFDNNDVYAYFFEKKWSEQLGIMNPGDHIGLVGRIKSIDPQTVHLHDCELVD